MIQELLKFLKKNNLVDISRPNNRDQFENSKPFILETFISQKVIIPQENLKKISGLNGLSIWVSDSQIHNLNFELTDDINETTILYLSEVFWEDGLPQNSLSGLTALQALTKLMVGENYCFSTGMSNRADYFFGVATNIQSIN